MLSRSQLQFLIQVLEARDAGGRPLVSVGIEHAGTAHTTYLELRAQLEALPKDEPGSRA